LDFKVIEFNRDAKRILLSHLRTWEERKEAPVKEAKAAPKKEAQPELPKMEKTTLGDLGALADLHASMAAAEKPAKKTTKKAAKKEAEEAAE
jgi:small subunit ribosomal protein S1